MLTSKTLLFLALLAAFLLATVVSAQNCAQFTNCDDCTGETSGACGWCESTDECLAGNSVGPGGSALNCTEWFYDNCLAVDCFRFSTCLTCLRDPFCGWCETSSTCVEGLVTGPVSGSCSDYIFSRSECPATTTTSSTTGVRATTTGRRTTSSSTATSTSGASTASSTASSTSGASTSATGTTGSRTSGGSSSTGRRTTSTGRRTSSSSTGRQTSSTTGSGSGSGSSTTGTPNPPPPPPPVTTATSTGSGTTGGSSSAAYSVSSASLFVAVGVVVVALLNLLW